MKDQLNTLNTYFWNVGNDIADIRLLAEGALALFEGDAEPLHRLGMKNNAEVAASAFDTIGSLSHPIDRKPLRAEKAQLEQEVESLRPDVDAVQAELDELKTVRYWVRKVVPDALPSRAESGAASLRNSMEESQNQNELNDLLERTAKQVVSPQQGEVHRATQRQRNETL